MEQSQYFRPQKLSCQDKNENILAKESLTKSNICVFFLTAKTSKLNVQVKFVLNLS